MLAHYLDEPFAHAFASTGGSDLDFFTPLPQGRALLPGPTTPAC